MEERTLQFIAALRAQGVRVSLAESADAFLAMQELGIQDRQRFRGSLRATLIKDQRDLPTFERLFDLFFQAEPPPPMQNLLESLSPRNSQKPCASLLRHCANVWRSSCVGKNLRQRNSLN